MPRGSKESYTGKQKRKAEHIEEGYVARGGCETDRRVVYAVLTDEGLEKLREASKTHIVQIEDFFSSRYEDAELADLNGLLARIEPGESLDCGP